MAEDTELGLKRIYPHSCSGCVAFKLNDNKEPFCKLSERITETQANKQGYNHPGGWRPLYGSCLKPPTMKYLRKLIEKQEAS